MPAVSVIDSRQPFAETRGSVMMFMFTIHPSIAKCDSTLNRASNWLPRRSVLQPALLSWASTLETLILSPSTAIRVGGSPSFSGLAEATGVRPRPMWHALYHPIMVHDFGAFLLLRHFFRRSDPGASNVSDRFDIYGAVAQQLFSVILESNGAYLRISDLAEHFAGWPHMETDVIEDILHGVAESGHLTRHGFQNRFGAGDKLHRLRDLRLIWGNFPLRSRDVRLMTNGREIGNVPVINLMRLSAGVVVRFAGRHWRVRRVYSDHIDVEPCRSTGGSGD